MDYQSQSPVSMNVYYALMKMSGWVLGSIVRFKLFFGKDTLCISDISSEEWYESGIGEKPV